MAEHLSVPALARLLSWDDKTLRAAHAAAEKRHNQGTEPRKGDAALLKATGTPGGQLRWARADAADVLRAFGHGAAADALDAQSASGPAGERGAA